MIKCLHCSAETSNGLALCELCQRFAGSIFETLPVYIRNLARQRRPARPNGSLGTAGQWLIQRGETDGSKVEVTLSRVYNDLDTWAECLGRDRDVELPKLETDADTAVALVGILDKHLTSIATLEWAGQFLRDMARHERNLRALTEAVVPGWYAGACRQVTGKDMEGNVYTCGVDTYVVPGLTWVTCGSCGATTYARDHLENVLDEAREWVARPKALAEAVVALVDTEASVPRLYTRIRQWAHQGDLQSIRRSVRGYVWSEERKRFVVAAEEVGYARYRMGDVLALTLRRNTRIDTKGSKSERAS